jgi:hypothetical protein
VLYVETDTWQMLQGAILTIGYSVTIVDLRISDYSSSVMLTIEVTKALPGIKTLTLVPAVSLETKAT